MGLEKEEVRRTKWALVETRSGLFCLRRDNQRGRAKHEHQQEHSCATCRAFFKVVGKIDIGNYYISYYLHVNA